MNLPGVPFHVTARLQNREPLFCGLERHVVRILLQSAELYEVRVVAYAIMPNHLHLVLVQGEEPLGRVMQAIGRRIALLVQRATGRIGHVFERSYFAAPCLDAEYFRNAVAYVHLNPVRARLCDTADGYGWSSHEHYLRCEERKVPQYTMSYDAGLRLFAEQPDDSLAECKRGYTSFLRYRSYLDALAEMPENKRVHLPAVPPPMLLGGDRHWLLEFARAAERAADALKAVPVPPPDLRTIALRTIEDPHPDAVLELLRLGGRSHEQVQLRRAIIARSLGAGHRPCQVARFLHVSDIVVGRVATSLRRRPACPIDI